MSAFGLSPQMAVVFLCALAPIFALFVVTWVERRRQARVEKRRHDEKLLRPPGHSLALRLDEMQDTFFNRMFGACALCAMAGAFVVPVANLWKGGAGMFSIGLFVLPLAAFAISGFLMVRRALRQRAEARNHWLGLRGEQAVAETLHEVADSGYRVFHDLPGGSNWNIDHVVAGPRGVFLIETKARRRRVGKRNEPTHVVHVDGETLRFPSGDDRKAIPQARRNARWLEDFLTKKTGEKVNVESFVVLPGWYVENGKTYPPTAMNDTYLAGYLRSQVEKLPPAEVRRIITALDEKCRDMEFE